jgi:hypothetical protein
MDIEDIGCEDVGWILYLVDTDPKDGFWRTRQLHFGFHKRKRISRLAGQLSGLCLPMSYSSCFAGDAAGVWFSPLGPEWWGCGALTRVPASFHTCAGAAFGPQPARGRKSHDAQSAAQVKIPPPVRQRTPGFPNWFATAVRTVPPRPVQ